jgi:small-conductance mechanosensitive channel
MLNSRKIRFYENLKHVLDDNEKLTFLTLLSRGKLKYIYFTVLVVVGFFLIFFSIPQASVILVIVGVGIFSFGLGLLVKQIAGDILSLDSISLLRNVIAEERVEQEITRLQNRDQ